MYRCLRVTPPSALWGALAGGLAIYLAMAPPIHTFWQHLAGVAIAGFVAPLFSLLHQMDASGEPRSVLDESLSQQLQRASERIGDSIRVPVCVSFGGLYKVAILGMSRQRCKVVIPHHLLEALDETELDLVLLHTAAHLKHLSPGPLLRPYLWWILEYWLMIGWVDVLWWLGWHVHFSSAQTWLSVVGAAFVASWGYGHQLQELMRRHEIEADSVASQAGGDPEKYLRLLERLGELNSLNRFAQERAERVWRLRKGLP